MNLLDMKTIIFSYAISNFICMIVMLTLWKQYRLRFAGLGFWLADYGLQFAALVLLILRGTVPDILSMTGSNAMVVGGTILLYMGLEHFMSMRSAQLHNYVFLAVFILAHAYFVFMFPSLNARNILFTLAILFICVQSAWLMLRRSTPKVRAITSGVGYVFIAFCLLSVVRIGVDLAIPAESDFFHSNVYETALLLAYQMLFIVLTISLCLMVNHRLFADLERDIVVRKHMEEALRLSEEKFSKAFQSSPDAFLISRLSDGHFIEVNAGFCRLTGYSREEALSSSSISLGLWANPQDREKVVEILQANSRVHDYEFNVRTKSGILLRALYFGEIINLGDEVHVLSVVRDISERKRADAVVNLRLMLWEFSVTHSTIETMQKALDEIEILTGSLIGFYHLMEEDQNALTLQAWSTRTKKEFCQAEGEGMHYSIDQAGVWVDCVRQKKPVIHNNYASLPHRKGMPAGHAEVIRELVVPVIRDGQVVSILGVGNKPLDYDENDIELVAYIADVVWIIIAQKRADEQIHYLNNQLEHLSLTDDLTGLVNRRAFFLLGDKEIKRARRYHNPLTLIMLDIDRFKNINDTYGHAAGDAALQCFAKTLQRNGREVDVIARLGGEEFGILLPNTKPADAVKLAERLRLTIEGEGCFFQGQSTSLTASIGVAAYNKEMKTLDALIRNADAAMYQAKNKGRNCVVLQD